MNLKKAKIEELKVSEACLKNSTKGIILKENIPQNMFFSDEGLTTRPGLFPFDELIFDSDKTYNNYAYTEFTDCYYYRDELKGRVFIIIDDNDMSNATYHFHIMWSDGSVQQIGKIEFTRASSTTFGRPESFTIYTGKATRGCGIYFLVRLVYENGQEDFVRMYELNAQMDGWDYIYSDDYYVPTVLAFGRGQSYHIAEELDSRISFSRPIKPESENLLTDRFLAYYTTDGYSEIFELPFKEIGDGVIRCIYTDFSSNYYLTIDSGENLSNGVIIDSKTYYVYCNRKNGTLCFADENNVRTAPPFAGMENNLKVSASRKESDDLRKLAAMSKSMSIPAGRKGSGNQTVIFYGNMLSEAGKICWINSENPLYFPKDLSATPGNIANKLEGAYVYQNKLYVYDNEKRYSASVHTADSFDLPLVIKGVLPANTIDYDRITFNGTVILPQELIPSTVTVFPDNVLVSGKNGEIYEQSGESPFRKVADLSGYGFVPEVAASYKNGYLLINDRDGYYYDPSKESLFYWELNANVIGTFSFSDECIIFAKCLCKQYRHLIYALSFTGNTDGAVTDISSVLNKFFVEVESILVCEFETEDVYHKRLHTVIIDTGLSKNTFRANLFAEGSRALESDIQFKGGTKSIRYGVRFKRLKLRLVGIGLTFRGAKALYYGGKTF